MVILYLSHAAVGIHPVIELDIYTMYIFFFIGL